MKKALYILIFIGSMGLLQAQPADDHDALVNEIIAEGERVRNLLAYDSTFTTQITQTLHRVEEENGNHPAKGVFYHRLLNHFKAIRQNNRSRVKLDFEESYLFWFNPMLNSSNDTAKLRATISRGFPDTYFAARNLVPEFLTDSMVLDMADQYPKELLYMLRYMIDPDALVEAERAATNAPYEAKQYLHYSNNINKLLRKSEDPIVLKLLELFNTYKYSSNSYYLVQSILDESITKEEAHEIGKDREQFYNALVDIYTTENSIGKHSVEEKLSEFSDRYVRKLMFQRYLSSSSLKLDQLEVLSQEAIVYFLFRSQNMLKKKDLQNMAKLFKRYEVAPMNAEIATWIPNDWILMFEIRLAEENLQQDYVPFIQNDLWAAAKPVESVIHVFEPAPLEITEETVNPAEPVYVFKPYLASLSEDEKLLIRLENNPYELLKDLSKVTGQMYSRKMIMQLAMEHPVEVMAQLDKFMDQPYAGDVCRELAINAPLTAKNYIVNKQHKIHTFLKGDSSIYVQTLYAIDKELGNWTRAYILYDKIVSQEITLQEADEICKDKELLLPHLLDIYTKRDHLGHYTVEKELEYAALNFVRKFNISENTDHSFLPELEKLDARILLMYMLLGEQEIISKTFTKMYDRLMVLRGHDLDALFASVNYLQVDQFIRMVLHYGKEYDLFRRLDTETTDQLWSLLFKGLENGGTNSMKQAIDAAEIIIGLNDRTRLRAIHQIIQDEYERLAEEKDDQGSTAYGILAGIMAQKLREGWSVYAAPYYKIPDLISIPVYHLFNEKLVNIQHYYFYNDRDGKYSYRNFLKQYQRSNYNWKIEEKGSFVKITSKTGKKVEIYANIPEKGEDGIKALEQYLETQKLQPQIVVHRGLSTHTLKTFRKVPSSAKLILDGSCGGFHIQSVALQNAPGAHILCNRNIGTMHINDPMFMQISESIRKGNDIVWPSFWDDMEARLGTNPYFKDYIPPHKNVAALIIKAYYDVLDIHN
ncbi:MAG: hypothetical protein GY751_26540 [Bacteroidetes bacterium]|nr:hypothetical protein [Bacteroidota bacterium]